MALADIPKQNFFIPLSRYLREFYHEMLISAIIPDAYFLSRMSQKDSFILTRINLSVNRALSALSIRCYLILIIWLTQSQTGGIMWIFLEVCANERQNKIYDIVSREGAVTTSGLVDIFGVSIETIRRDLVSMELYLEKLVCHSFLGNSSVPCMCTLMEQKI